MDSDDSKSNTVFRFVDGIQNSVMSNSKKLTDSIKGSDTEDPLLLTSNIKKPVDKSILMNSKLKTSNESLVKGEPLTIDGNVKSQDTSKSWLNISKTTRIWLKVIVVIVLLGFVGINVFLYLGFSFKKLYGLLDNFINYIKGLLTGKPSKQKSKPK